jgi:hypothetical protein
MRIQSLRRKLIGPVSCAVLFGTQGNASAQSAFAEAGSAAPLPAPPPGPASASPPLPPPPSAEVAPPPVPAQPFPPPPPFAAPVPVFNSYPPFAAPSFPACTNHATPSPCVQPADAYRHDGFYLRFLGGVDYLSFSGTGPSGSASVSGVSPSSTVAIGGTVGKSVVLAGTFRYISIRERFHGSPHQPEGYATATAMDLGLLVDWFPNPAEGWHFGGMASLSNLSIWNSWIPDSSGGAVAGTLLGGYDWWIGPQWSLGLMGVVSASTSTSLSDTDTREDTGYRFHALSAGLEYGITLH